MTRKKQIVRFDQHRSCHQMFGERWFSGSFTHQHCWHDRMDEICERNRNVELARRNTQLVPIVFVGEPRSKVPRKRCMERKLNICKIMPSKDTGKGKRNGKGKQHGKNGKKRMSRYGGARRQTRNTHWSRIHRVDGHELGSRWQLD